MHLGRRQEQEKLICLYIGQMKIQPKLDMYFASLKKKKKKSWCDPLTGLTQNLKNTALPLLNDTIENLCFQTPGDLI